MNPVVVDEGEALDGSPYLRLTRRWMWWAPMFVVLFPLAFCCLVVLVVEPSRGRDWFAVLTVAGGSYVLACVMFNRTEVIFTRERIEVRVHPLPWGLGTRLSAREVVEVKSEKQRASRNHSGEAYELTAVLRSEETRCLLVVDTRGEAGALAARITRWRESHAVSGESGEGQAEASPERGREKTRDS